MAAQLRHRSLCLLTPVLAPGGERLAVVGLGGVAIDRLVCPLAPQPLTAVNEILLKCRYAFLGILNVLEQLILVPYLFIELLGALCGLLLARVRE